MLRLGLGLGNTSLYLVLKEQVSTTVAKAAVRELRLSRALSIIPKGVCAGICFGGGGFATGTSPVLSGG